MTQYTKKTAIALSSLFMLMALLSLGQKIASHIAVGGEAFQYEWALLTPLKWMVWSLLAPVVVFWFERASQKDTLTTKSPAKLILVFLLVSCIHITISMLILNIFWLLYLGYFMPVHVQIWFVIPEVFTINLIVLAAIIGGSIAFRSYTQRRELELRSSKLENQLSKAKIAALQRQMQPHFLFNALNALNTMILKKDHLRSEQMLNKLSTLLRETIDSGDDMWVSLEEELRISKRYLDIHEVRFEDRLQVHYDIDEEALSCVVPNFLLQPYIENAIKHGISKHSRAGIIRLGAQRFESQLSLKIYDNGPGANFDDITEGVGLKNTRNRLLELYGSNASVTYGALDGIGFQVQICLPFQTTYEEN
jgi:two-component system LytT family sensor kinase